MFFLNNAAHRGRQRLFFLWRRLFSFFFYALFLRFGFFHFFLGFFLFCGLVCLFFTWRCLRIIDRSHHLADFYLLTLGGLRFDNTRFFSNDLACHFVGFVIEEG